MNTTLIMQKEQQLRWEIEQQHSTSRSIVHARNETEQIFNVACPLCVINKDFTIIRVNDTFCDLFKLRKETITGKPCHSIWECSICNTAFCPLLTVLKTSKQYSIEGVKIRSDQNDKICFISASPFYDSDYTIIGIVENIVDITVRNKIECELATKQKQCEEQNILLSEKNAALRELMRQIEREKEFTKKNIHANVHHLIQPLIDQLRHCSKNSVSDIINCIERNLSDLTSPFGRQLIGNYSVLSQKEISICNLIRNGLTTKDISQYLHLSEKTIETHRKNIRKKLKITNKQQNLQSVLRLMSQ